MVGLIVEMSVDLQGIRPLCSTAIGSLELGQRLSKNHTIFIPLYHILSVGEKSCFCILSY